MRFITMQHNLFYFTALQNWRAAYGLAQCVSLCCTFRRGFKKKSGAGAMIENGEKSEMSPASSGIINVSSKNKKVIWTSWAALEKKSSLREGGWSKCDKAYFVSSFPVFNARIGTIPQRRWQNAYFEKSLFYGELFAFFLLRQIRWGGQELNF